MTYEDRLYIERKLKGNLFPSYKAGYAFAIDDYASVYLSFRQSDGGTVWFWEYIDYSNRKEVVCEVGDYSYNLPEQAIIAFEQWFVKSEYYELMEKKNDTAQD